MLHGLLQTKTSVCRPRVVVGAPRYPPLRVPFYRYLKVPFYRCLFTENRV